MPIYYVMAQQAKKQQNQIVEIGKKRPELRIIHGNAGAPLRIDAVDYFRGIAVVLMIIFHATYDLKKMVYGFEDLLPRNYWSWFPSLIGSMFFFTMGYATYLAPKFSYKRALKVFSLGLLVSLSSYLYSPDMLITFGVLHSLGLSMFLIHPFMKLQKKYASANFFIGFAVIAIGNWFYTKEFNTVDWLFPLGIRAAGFSSADYYPIFPWFGVALLGAFAAQKTASKLASAPFHFAMKKSVSWLGKHSLAIYLIHQPILIGLISLLKLA